MRELKEEKEFRVLLHSMAEHKRLLFARKERRLKSMNA